MLTMKGKGTLIYYSIVLSLFHTNIQCQKLFLFSNAICLENMLLIEN
jgi:hypothetical protein